jgi:hypothetical protein
MSKIALDLKQFKHVKSDKHSTTLQHKDGHTLTIAHKKMSPDAQAQLEALQNSNISPKDQKEGNISSKKDDRKMYANPTGEVSSEDSAPVQSPQDIMDQEISNREQKQEPLPGLDVTGALQGDTKGFKEKSQDNAHSEELAKEGLDTQALTDIEQGKYSPNMSVGKPANPMPTTQTPITPQTQQTPQPQTNITPQQSPPQSKMSNMEEAAVAQKNALEKQRQGMAAEQTALGDQGTTQAAAEAQYQRDAGGIRNMYAKLLKEIADEMTGVQKDIQSGHIDPNHYINSMTTGGKISTGIGLLLGGLGAGLAGGRNLASDYFDKQIDNDIMAQKVELGKKENLLSHLTQKYGNVRLAQQEAKLFANEMLTHKLNQIAMQTADPMAKARIMQLNGQIDGKQADLAQNIAGEKLKMSLMDPSQSGDIDPAQKVQFLVPKEHQAKSLDEIGKAMNVRRNYGRITAAFDQAAKENTVLRTGAGVFREPGSVMELRQLMLPNFKQIDGTVRQAAMDESFHNMIPAPGDTDAKIAIKRKAMQEWMTSESAAPFSRGFGIDLDKSPYTAIPKEAAPQQPRMGDIIKNEAGQRKIMTNKGWVDYNG